MPRVFKPFLFRHGDVYRPWNTAEHNRDGRPPIKHPDDNLLPMPRVIAEDTWSAIRDRGGVWFAYQDQHSLSGTVGDLRFIRVGTPAYPTPPQRLPTSPLLASDWVLIGRVAPDASIEGTDQMPQDGQEGGGA